MGLGGVAIATLPSVIFSKLMFSDGLGGVSSGSMGIVCKDYNIIAKNPFATFLFQLNKS